MIQFHEDDSLALYNLANDLGEKLNLADKMPDQTASPKKRLENWRVQVEAQMTSPNPDYDPARAAKVRR